MSFSEEKMFYRLKIIFNITDIAKVYEVKAGKGVKILGVDTNKAVRFREIYDPFYRKELRLFQVGGHGKQTAVQKV
ncbi:hypothetical protein E2C01_059658 [Portunus trituberculatus]|uniref:Uncharacterized protein n=1 Tax=Portunus trituberculatus TaxID=210409 RepID=A0A5B7H367_PORTR|nr:hypothetical protein [Portunus trituberculatus]